MSDQFYAARDKIMGGLYRQVLKRFFFLQDPERVHDGMISMGERLGKYAAACALVGEAFGYENKILEQTLLGIDFASPIGLAAGFDKDARLTQILPAVGFGFGEVGSITGEVCGGNPKPRLQRLPKSRSLLIYYGLKNDGCETISARLEKQNFKIPIGISVAKTNCAATVPTEAGIADYLKAFKIFVDRGVGDYFTINISCPNAFGGQPFTDADSLEKLLTAINQVPTTKPIFIKLSPDLSREEIDRILGTTGRHRIDGFICTNLTKNRDSTKIKETKILEKGGLSGHVVQGLSDDLIKYIYRKVGDRYVIIGCGGIFSAEDAYRKIRLGASLIQMITGMIYQGPQVIGEINRGLVKLLRRDGFKNISEAVGVDNR
ncbi:MAG: quinone-dependent dihydroorotate dehydrogenase [Patescibacteria group bacterium]|nr:quinone-dependent dihydroorotate dehydrogenase [Patescibacteria group bacterium]